MNQTEARELLSCALERVERAIKTSSGRVVIDVRLWPTPLIMAVVAVLRRRGRIVRKETRELHGYSGPALVIELPASTQRELSYG